MDRIKNLIAKFQSKKMWKEIRKREAEILEQNKTKTFIMCMYYIQRKELRENGLLPTLREQTKKANAFYNNLKTLGLIDKNNRPLESIVETLKEG